MLSPGALRSSPELPTVDPGMQAGQLPRVTVDPASPIGERPPLSRRSTGLRPEALVVDEDDDRQGVYDSSHKKRVPSWYVVKIPVTKQRLKLSVGVIGFFGSLL